MNSKIAMVTAGILVAGLMVVASYTSSVWAKSTSTGTATDTSASTSASSTGSAASATGGGIVNGVPIIGSSSTGSKGDAAAAGGLINICGDSVNIIGACSGTP